MAQKRCSCSALLGRSKGLLLGTGTPDMTPASMRSWILDVVWSLNPKRLRMQKAILTVPGHALLQRACLLLASLDYSYCCYFFVMLFTSVSVLVIVVAIEPFFMVVTLLLFRWPLFDAVIPASYKKFFFGGLKNTRWLHGKCTHSQMHGESRNALGNTGP